ncbi:Hypothetical predicted protein [Paramuricea clavata]|uniref:Uncharacterized protein n=1 Tax=Paramuricea clavata TaxID=317549 RepID=A0A7D9E7Z6_PARCT|nr:Hypothetical predicted protein [Paramuricea clavata]
MMNLGMIKYRAEGEFVKKVDARESDDTGRKCKPEDKVQKERLRKILQKHRKMFHGIGTLKNPETGESIFTHIEMNVDAKPVIQPPKTCTTPSRRKNQDEIGLLRSRMDNDLD